MSDPKIVASARERSRRAAEPAQASQGWTVLGWIGLAFLVVGGVDFALVWFPLGFGTREWEFATVTQSFNGLPILLLGVGLLVVAAQQVGRRWWGLVGVGVAAVLLVWILAGAALWASNVSLALSTVPEELRVGVQKAVARTAVQSVVYPLVLLYLVWRVLRRAGAETMRAV